MSLRIIAPPRALASTCVRAMRIQGRGYQLFTFIGSTGFSGAAGELRFAGGLLQGGVGGDGVADFQARFSVRAP